MRRREGSGTQFPILTKGTVKNMESVQEKLENYQKNLRCLQEVTEELLSHMKGRDWSFRQSITDKKGKPSQEKLQALVTELLDIWAAKVRECTDADPDTGESLAEPWLQERRELYSLYLYLVMRCSLEKGGYRDARGGAELKERTDFAFLLEQARRLSRDWCVLAGPDGTRRNELYWGYDAYFGFHLYYALHDPDVLKGYINPGNDWSLTPDWKRACDQPVGQLTNEGNLKRIYLRHSGFRFSKAAPEEESEPKEKSEPEEKILCEETEELALPDEEYGYDAWDLADDDDWYFPFPSAEVYYEFQAAEWEQRSEEAGRSMGLTLLAAGFEGSGEYCSACKRFAELFQAARPEVLRDFYTDLEEIVDLYLAVREIAPLTDTNKTLNVYSRIYDGPLQHAKRCGRGLQWETL